MRLNIADIHEIIFRLAYQMIAIRMNPISKMQLYFIAGILCNFIELQTV